MPAGMIVAQCVLLEARRSGLPLVILAVILGGIVLASFFSRLALTESMQVELVVLAAMFRLVAVFLTAAFVITSMVRESSEKGTELFLSLPISRATYYLGKLAGYGLTGIIISIAFTLAVALFSPFQPVALWCCSLALETFLFAAVGLFFVVSLGQTLPALSATVALYILGRTIGAMQSISASPLVNEQGYLNQIAGGIVDAIALVLPSLDRVTRTDWLIYSPPAAPDFLNVLATLTIYLTLMAAAGLFDFYRRNL